MNSANSYGRVYLVGAGPGDPGLLTVYAHTLIENCDALVYDNLVSKEIISLSPVSAIKIYAGKESGNHSLEQDEINDLLLHLSENYTTVVRLKGGDPVVFGRGGEEYKFLSSHGVSVKIIPGITTASAAAAYSGISLTHREHADQLILISGHKRKNEFQDSFKQIHLKNKTIVIYMGLGRIESIMEDLLNASPYNADVPVCIIENASRLNQKICKGTVASIVEEAKLQKITSPAVIIIGEVVKEIQKDQITSVEQDLVFKEGNIWRIIKTDKAPFS